MEYKDKKENSEEAIKSLKDADSIIFSANITNEEAFVFQSLKEKYNIKLICTEAKAYQDFLKAYSSCSGYHVFEGDLHTLAASEVVISFGAWFGHESTESMTLIRKTLEEKKADFVYMHPIEDETLQPSITQFIKYEAGSEEGVAALLAHTLLEGKNLPKEIEDILEDFDIGYLSAESNVGEEELESMHKLIDKKTTISLIIGSDLYTHPKAGQIATLIALLEKYARLHILCVPPDQNALGVALICQLDDVVQGRSIIYKSCKEGTYVNVDKCVCLKDGMHASGVDGLNKIANTLDLQAQNLIEYSNQLPQDEGFQTVNDEDLKKPCMYRLMPQERISNFTLDDVDDLPVYDGAVIYTYKVEHLTAQERAMHGVLNGSKQFAMATKLQDGDLISFEIEGVKFTRVFKIDTHMKGVIALNPTLDINLSASLISSYKFSRVEIQKVGS